MNLERAHDHFGLAAHARVVESGAPPDHRFRRDAGQRAQDCGGGRAVRDTHLADADKRRAAVGQLACNLDSDVERSRRFVRRHRRAVEEVARACGDAPIRHARQRFRAGIDLDAHVDDLERVAEAASQHADRSAAGGDVAKHLGRDRLRKCADAFIRDAMIGDENRNGAASRFDRFVMADSSVPPHEFLETAEAAGRLGQRIQPRIGSPRRLVVERKNRSNSLFE